MRACGIFAFVAAIMLTANFAPAQVVVNIGGEGEGWVAGGAWGGGQNMQFDQFLAVVTQLNMTPDFTLDKAAKEKIAELREAWHKAGADYVKTNRDELQKLSSEQIDAFKSQDQQKIKDATKKIQDFYGRGPKADEYLAKAKATLTADQQKAVEAALAKNVELQKGVRVLEGTDGDRD